MTSLVLRDFCARQTQPPAAAASRADANNNNQHDERAPNANASSVKSKKGDKYSLRPRGAEHAATIASCLPGSKSTRGGGKSKQKAAPLSKYRRKTANARERTRMREINMAFEALRSCVPLTAAARRAQNNAATTAANEKLTKITTLRLAMQYIAALSGALQQNDDDAALQSPSSSSEQSCPADALRDFDLSDASSQDALLSGLVMQDFDDLELLLESDGESLRPTSEFSDTLSADHFEHSSLGEQSLSPPSGHFGLAGTDLTDPFDPFLAEFS